MQAPPPSGPSILGFDVVVLATVLSAVATFAVLLAIYAATTARDPMIRRVKALNQRREQLKAGHGPTAPHRKQLLRPATPARDPMTRRVRALNERREQLKAGIVASTNKRKKLTNKNEAADRVRSILTSFKMLQDDQLKKTQMKLMQAGIRTKDLAFFIIFARFILPLVLGVTAVMMIYVLDYFPEWSWWRRYGTVASILISAYKAPDIWLKNKIAKRSNAVRKGLPDALDLLVICAEAGLTVAAAFHTGARRRGRPRPR